MNITFFQLCFKVHFLPKVMQFFWNKTKCKYDPIHLTTSTKKCLTFLHICRISKSLTGWSYWLLDKNKLSTRSFSRHSFLIIKSFYCKIFLRVSCATTGWFWDTSRKNRALQTLKWQPNAISLFIDSMPGTLQGYLTDQVSSKAFSIRTCY